MSNTLGMAIESLVAVLLLLTVGYCIVLNSRLRRLKADEMALKATISELITATEIAERAIAGLRITVRDCDQTLGERLRTAERFSADIAVQLAAGEEIIKRLGEIAVGARPKAEAGADPATTGVQAIVKAAQAFTARARAKQIDSAAA